MNHTELPFPRRELNGAQHLQIREFLVRETSSPARTRRPTRRRIVVPIAALAVGAAAAGSTVALGNWHQAGTPATPAAQIDDAAACGYARHASPAKGKGLLYLAPAPAGMTYTSWVNEARFCATDNTRPVVTFVREKKGGVVTAAITVWRSLPPGIGAEGPAGAAAGGALTAAADGDDAGTVKKPPSSKVAVRATDGRLIKGGKLTWVEPDGQRWSLTGAGLSDSELGAIAGELTLGKTAAGWPKAADRGFRTLSVPPQSQPKDKSWQPIWYVDYTLVSGGQGSALSVDVNRTRRPWQVGLSLGPMPVRLVTVHGRPAELTDNGGPKGALLFTDTADGAQLTLMGSVPAPSTLVKFAEQLELVAPDDPRIHEPDFSHGN